MDTVIKIENIRKSFGEDTARAEVLKGISLDIERGEFLSIMGPSGCGKSTLLYLLGGLDQPDSGRILLFGGDLRGYGDRELSRIRRRRLGFVFQFYNLVQNLTVEENILLPIVMDGRDAREIRERLDKLLGFVGLSDRRNAIPSRLSGGEQQRVAIARAMIAEPDILLADEPTGNLDSVNGSYVMELFKRANREFGLTIVQVTHSEESALCGTRLVRLRDGRVESISVPGTEKQSDKPAKQGQQKKSAQKPAGGQKKKNPPRKGKRRGASY